MSEKHAHQTIGVPAHDCLSPLGIVELEICSADASHADEMSTILNEIRAVSGRAGRHDATYSLERYIAHPARVDCYVSLDERSRVVGFQSLKRAWEGNPYGVTPGWGIIGTHISPRAARRGVGLALFRRTVNAAASVVLPAIDATIAASNAPGLAFYEKLGFRMYRYFEDCICKSYPVAAFHHNT